MKLPVDGDKYCHVVGGRNYSHHHRQLMRLYLEAVLKIQFKIIRITYVIFYLFVWPIFASPAFYDVLRGPDSNLASRNPHSLSFHCYRSSPPQFVRPHASQGRGQHWKGRVHRPLKRSYPKRRKHLNLAINVEFQK
jgi:hypothetical protein